MKKSLRMILCLGLAVQLSLGMICASAAAPTADPDVTGDQSFEAADLVEYRKILLGTSEIEFYDVNGDGKCNLKDLVSLKKMQAGIYGADNLYPDDWD